MGTPSSETVQEYAEGAEQTGADVQAPATLTETTPAPEAAPLTEGTEAQAEAAPAQEETKTEEASNG